MSTTTTTTPAWTDILRNLFPGVGRMTLEDVTIWIDAINRAMGNKVSAREIEQAIYHMDERMANDTPAARRAISPRSLVNVMRDIRGTLRKEKSDSLEEQAQPYARRMLALRDRVNELGQDGLLAELWEVIVEPVDWKLCEYLEGIAKSWGRWRRPEVAFNEDAAADLLERAGIQGDGEHFSGGNYAQ